MSLLIDTHCHLDLFQDIQLNKQAEDVSGIKTITVTNAPSFFEPNTQLFGGCNNIRVGLGLHPQLSEQYQGEAHLFDSLLKHVRYIGEIGLDGSSDLKKTYALQKKLFANILSAVRSQDSKVLTVHSRNAAGDTIETLDRYLRGTNCKVILHWYSGSLSDLTDAVVKGFFFSINHKMVATDKGKELIRNIPENRLLTETDAPFTFSGQINTRLKSLSATLAGIGSIKKKSPDEVRDIVFCNFRELIS